MFQFYATSDRRTARALVAQAVASGEVFSGRGGTGGALSSSMSASNLSFAGGSVTGAHGLTLSGRTPGRATRGCNTMKEALGYAEFLKFSSDFDLSSSVILSTLEIGDIYLSSIKVSCQAAVRQFYLSSIKVSAVCTRDGARSPPNLPAGRLQAALAI